MKKLKCLHVYRYLVHFLIVIIIILTVSYLIMVSTKLHKMSIYYSSFDLRESNEFHKDYTLRKRNAENIVQSSQISKQATQETKLKVILIWSPLFKDWNFLQLGKTSFRKSRCLETRCEITSDRKRLFESDAVLFHIRTLSMFDIPNNRTQGQKWVFFTLEAPPYSIFQGFHFMADMFNWTMTYRKDSDIFIPYGRIISTDNNNFSFSDLHEKWRNKTKIAAWMVSHCYTDGNRERYIDQLKSVIDIDTYGSCGLGTCPFNKTNLCIENFSKQYHFFLAFENAICDDYITEKLFRTLQYEMIPVVFGGGDYISMAPEDSYIDALSFHSPKHLSSHLLKVASNFSLFSSYFRWRAKAYSDDTPNHCQLCQKLNSEDFRKHSVYHDINEWWIKKSNCKTWKDGNYSN